MVKEPAACELAVEPVVCGSAVACTLATEPAAHAQAEEYM